MSASRFFVAQIHQVGDEITIEGDDAHKIVQVLRMRTGDSITICDSGANEFTAPLTIDGAHVRARLLEKTSVEERASLRITVAQGVPKAQKMDFVVEKLTELGVATIVPLFSERTVADVTVAKHERWSRLAKAASQQSGRRDIPTIDPPATLTDFLARAGTFDRVLLSWELAERIPFQRILPPLLEGATSLAVIIGPEGGFSHAEAAAAQAAGAVPISLGSRILRTETAALVFVSILNYLTETR